MPEPSSEEAPSSLAKLTAVVLILAGAAGAFAMGRLAGRAQVERERKLAAKLSDAALRVAREALAEQAKLIPKPAPLALRVTTGMRALALPVDEAIAQTLQPGDRVDILVNVVGPFREEDSEKASEELGNVYSLQDVIVHAVEQDSLLLELTPSEIALLAVALNAATERTENFAPFEIVERNPQDDGFLGEPLTLDESKLADDATLERIAYNAITKIIYPIYGGPIIIRGHP